MQLNTLPKSTNKKKAPRVGRGGKRGTFSGRGVKGQKSRAGRKLRPAMRDLVIRIPKRRGFRNKPKSKKPLALTLEALSHIMKRAGNVTRVDVAFLKKVGAMGRGYATVKILGTGTITLPLTLSGLTVSKSAREKIEKAGGTIQASPRE